MNLKDQAQAAYAKVADEREAAARQEDERRRAEIELLNQQALDELKKQIKEKLGYEVGDAPVEFHPIALEPYAPSLPEVHIDGITLTLINHNDELALAYRSPSGDFINLVERVDSLEDVGEALAKYERLYQRFHSQVGT